VGAAGWLSDFDLLRAYIESRGTAVAGVDDLVAAARELASGRKLPWRNRAAILLWHLGLARAAIEGEKAVLLAARSTARVAAGDLALLAARVARWTPMRILVKYLAERGPAAAEEVAAELGARSREVTGRYLPVLQLAFKLREPAAKPFNRHVVEAVLFKLGSQLGLLEVEGGEARPTELALELAWEPEVVVVKTAPRAPLALAAAACALAQAAKPYLVSPWIDPEVARALAQLVRGGVVVSRPPRDSGHERALAELAERCEVRVYERLHTKLALGRGALVTSANMTKASLLRNLETGVYYRETPEALREHAEEVAATAREWKGAQRPAR
jgi:hypothetical protein